MSLFALAYDFSLAPMERFGLRRARARLVAQARGRILELGAGTGLNLPHYGQAELVLTEPDPAMLRRAQRRLMRLASAWGGQHPSYKLVQADAQRLPFYDASFDTVLATLVFCTVPDPLLGLREAQRVLRPGGQILLLEHVRAPWPFLALVQDATTPLWKHVAGGCHLNRDTLSTVLLAGYSRIRVRRYLRGLLLEIVAQRAVPDSRPLFP